MTLGSEISHCGRVVSVTVVCLLQALAFFISIFCLTAKNITSKTEIEPEQNVTSRIKIFFKNKLLPVIMFSDPKCIFYSFRSGSHNRVSAKSVTSLTIDLES